MTTSPTASTKRHRWQFSLRALLSTMLVVSALFGWLAVAMKQSREEHLAAAEIRRLGGTAMHCHQYDRDDEPNWFSEVDWPRKILGDDFFVTINYVSLQDSDITDANLVHLRALPHLQALHLNRCSITNDSLAAIGRLRKLERLSLGSTKITDDGLNQLARLRELEVLGLQKTSVSDAGLRTLRSLPRLREVDVTKTAVTDQGIAALTESSRKIKIRQ